MNTSESDDIRGNIRFRRTELKYMTEVRNAMARYANTFKDGKYNAKIDTMTQEIEDCSHVLKALEFQFEVLNSQNSNALQPSRHLALQMLKESNAILRHANKQSKTMENRAFEREVDKFRELERMHRQRALEAREDRTLREAVLGLEAEIDAEVEQAFAEEQQEDWGIFDSEVDNRQTLYKILETNF